jgi:hypothetical protein
MMATTLPAGLDQRPQLSRSLRRRHSTDYRDYHMTARYAVS